MRATHHGQNRSFVFLVSLLVVFPIHRASAFGAPITKSNAVAVSTTARRMLLDAADRDEETNSNDDSHRRTQEMLMEQLSARGAARIAKLSVRERTKRAMLAEAVEDQIFANTERLENLLEADGTLPPAKRQQAIDLASRTKTLQVQYKELVSGESSSVLNALEAAMGDGRNDGEKKDNEDETSGTGDQTSD